MRLNDYQWSLNPRGLHVQRVLITPLEIERWSVPRMGWVKLVAAGDEYVDDAAEFIRRGITPVLRLYRARWGARPLDRGMHEHLMAYASVGVKWFEFYNEPNLGIEWPEGVDPDWQDEENIIRPLMDNWLNWAEYVITLGGYPGFIPLAESTEPRYASVYWMDAFFQYMAKNRYDRFKNVLAGGMYCATHPYIFNHYYQEIARGGSRSARPPELQNAAEGGWHFEYPYDPICQSNDPGRTVYGGTALTPHGDPVGLLAMGRMFNDRAHSLFRALNVPVLGTEGGIWPFRDGQFQQDNRYPHYNIASQAEGTLAMFEWIARVAPPWFFGVCLWKEDDYYFVEGGKAPAMDRLAEVAPLHRVIPAFEVMEGGFTPVPIGPDGNALVGPGPIQGTPDHHMIILAPGLTYDWFFETAQAYWNLFRPIVTTRIDMIDAVPYDQSLAATVIATPDQVPLVTSAIQEKYRHLWFDLIVADDQDNVRTIFNERVQVNRRFG